MKKLLALALSISMALTLAACGAGNNSPSGSSTSSKSNASSSVGNSSSDKVVNVDFPTRTIEIVVSGTSGSESDMTARAYAKWLEEKWGVSVIVSVVSGNTPGSIHQVSDADPDGYSVLLINDSFFTSLVQGAHDVTLDDLSLLGIVQQADAQVLVVDKSKGWKTLDDYKAACEANPDNITLAVAFGSNSLVMGEMFRAAGIPCRLADSDGGADRVAQLLGGHVDSALNGLSLVKDYIESGDWIPLCILNEERSANFPDIPTAKEQGYDVVYPTRHIMALPADVPDEIYNMWADALEEIANDPEFKDYLMETSLSQAVFIPADEARGIYDEIMPMLEEFLGG